MLGKICGEINNYFVKEIHTGDFSIKNGTMSLDFLKEGQYFRIIGSDLNDGVYKYPVMNLYDENFNGAVWAMAVPVAFIKLCKDISDFETKNPASPYVSESFGGYTYTKATDENGAAASWQKVFAKDLNQYRRINVL